MSNSLQAMLKTLFLGLDELAPLSHGNESVAFLRAMHSPDISEYSHSREWLYEQSFAPYADRLCEAGYPVSPDAVETRSSLDRVLFAATRFAEENHATLARGWQMLKPGGWLVVAQHNDLGAKRLDAVLKQLGGAAQAVSKNHCRAVAVQKTAEEDATLLAAWRRQGEPQPVEGAPLQAAPGMFSWRKVDAGSRLLIDSLPKSLTGSGADIAAGWGYLSWAILETRPKVAHITLYEAEKRALELAGKNLQSHHEKTSFLWADATRKLEAAGQGFDWAVMNPPAHDLLHSAPEASAAIFARAAEALKPGAKLYLVANRHLPYERTLEELFSSVATLCETAEFKVIEATR